MFDRWYRMVGAGGKVEPIELESTTGSILLSGYPKRRIRYLEWKGGYKSNSYDSMIATSAQTQRHRIRITPAEVNGIKIPCDAIQSQPGTNGLFTDATGQYRDEVRITLSKSSCSVQITRNCAVRVLTGYEDGWVTPASDPTRHVLYLPDCRKPTGNSAESNVLCSWFSTTTYNELVNADADCVSNSSVGAQYGGIMLRIDMTTKNTEFPDGYTEEQKFKTWLSYKLEVDPVMICYPRVTPVTETIELSGDMVTALCSLHQNYESLFLHGSDMYIDSKYIGLTPGTFKIIF
mgnify:CR=1 FL=1